MLARFLVSVSLGLLIVGWISSPVLAQEASTTVWGTDVRKWIDQLSDPSFEAREQATKMLLKAGPAVASQLRAVQGQLSRDARSHVQRLLVDIDQRQYVQLAQEFLADLDYQQSHGLPAWKQFRSMVGHSRTSKLLFLQVIKQHRPIAELVETLHSCTAASQADQLQLQLEGQCQAVSDQLLTSLYSGTNIDIGDATAILLAVASLEGPVPIEANQLIHSCCQLGFSGYLQRQGYRACLQKMLERWVPKTQDAQAPEIMRLAFDLELSSIVPIARRHLSKSFDPLTRQQAILCLGRFGQPGDVQLLLKLAEDQAVIHQFSDTQAPLDGAFEESLSAPPGFGENPVTKPQRVVRVCDMAVASAMFLSQEDMASVFPNFTREKFLGRQLLSLSVAERELASRDDLLRTWSAGH